MVRIIDNPAANSRATPVALLPIGVGCAAMLGQVVLLREFLVLFNGNELSVGFVLAVWLAWTAAGAYTAGIVLKHVRRTALLFATAELLSGACLPLTVWVLRTGRILLPAVTGELLGPGLMLVTALIWLSVFCSLSGCLFAIAVQMYVMHRQVPAQRAVGVAYMLETIGSALGGILASFALLRFFGSFQIAALVFALNASMAAIVLLRGGRKTTVAVVLCAAVAVAPLVVFAAPRIERRAEQQRWPGIRVIESRDSIYGRITLTDLGGVKTVYDNGSVLANMPDPAAAEEAIHFALLQHPEPRNVLLIGGAAQGAVAEALRHATVEQIEYVELDPVLASMLKRIGLADGTRGLSDGRVHSHIGDGRHYLSTSRETFDAIVVNVPEPDTAQWNRFYTSEFFRAARIHLAPGGVLALQLRSSAEFISPQRAEFLRCIYRTLALEFPHIALVPGDPLHMISSERSGALAKNSDELIARMQARKLQLLYVGPYTLPFRMSPERTAGLEKVLRSTADTRINRDFHPVAYYFNAVLWNAQFDSTYALVLQRMAKVPFSLLLALACIPFVSVLPFRRHRDKASIGAAAARWAVLSGGYVLMTSQLLLLLGFQCLYGYVYLQLAILMGMFMAGLAVGTWLALRRTGSSDAKTVTRLAATNQFALSACAPLLMLVLLALRYALVSSAGDLFTASLLPLVGFACGVPGGMQFPLAAAIYGAGRSAESVNLGTLYALDLLGGCAGAILLGGLLIPVFGFWRVAWLAFVVALPAAFLLLRAAAAQRPSARVLIDRRIPVP